MRELFDLHNPDGPERCGVILEDGTILELDNVHPTPKYAFSMDAAFLNDSEVAATWHTHPITGPNLSVDDYRSFKMYPDLKHYIVAASEIWCFAVVNGTLLSCENLTKNPLTAPSPS